MKQASTNVTSVAAMSDEQLIEQAVTLLSNNRRCGGATIAGRRLAQRRLRRLGMRWWVGITFDPDGNHSHTGCGCLSPGNVPPNYDLIEVGVTLDAAAHKLGGGNATKGWEVYWKF